MDAIANLSFFRLHYDDKGVLQDSTELTRLRSHIAEKKPARLLVISHGWRNDAEDATALYEELVSNVSARLEALAVPASELPAVVGLYWPSMALPEEFRSPAAPAPGQDGAAAAVRAPDLKPDRIKARLDVLIDALGGSDELERAKALVDTLADSPPEQVEFVKLLRGAGYACLRIRAKTFRTDSSRAIRKIFSTGWKIRSAIRDRPRRAGRRTSAGRFRGAPRIFSTPRKAPSARPSGSSTT